MRRSHIPEALRRAVAEEAQYRCGYCQTAQEYCGMQFHVEHITPYSIGGPTIVANLWLACALCNGYKGARTHGVDPTSGETLPLFNPRTQTWLEHFAWSENGLFVHGRTPTGRATVEALQLNNEYVISARKHWVRVGWHPPRE